MGMLENLSEESFAAGWKPEAGDGIEGTVESLGERDGGYGVYPIVTIVLDDGERLAIHGGRTVLKDKIMETSPQPGDRFAVRYVGLVPGKKPGSSAYHSYLVGVERGSGVAPTSALAQASPTITDVAAKFASEEAF